MLLNSFFSLECTRYCWYTCTLSKTNSKLDSSHQLRIKFIVRRNNLVGDCRKWIMWILCWKYPAWSLGPAKTMEVLQLTWWESAFYNNVNQKLTRKRLPSIPLTRIGEVWVFFPGSELLYMRLDFYQWPGLSLKVTGKAGWPFKGLCSVFSLASYSHTF